METLLEDYKRKLQTIVEFIKNNKNNGSINDEKRAERLNTKAAVYRSFIVDIERALERTTNKNSISSCNVEISNWKDLKSQFGLEEVDGLKSALQIHKELKNQIDFILKTSKALPEFVCINCNEKSEAICIFHLVRNSPDNLEATYEYQGTAN